MSTTGSAVHSTLLERLFGDGVITAELRGGGDPGLLYPAEAAALPRAAAKRLRDYAGGRLCARYALAKLGICDFTLVPAHDRRPLWPPSIVGSITHTEGFCGAVAASHRDYRALGIDAEDAERVSENLWPRICTEAELDWLQQLPPPLGVRYAALIFSAKEAFYKCQYVLTEQWLGFQDASLDLTSSPLDSGEFVLQPCRGIALTALQRPPWRGRFTFTDGLVLSAMAFPAR
jgi:4'-phosphopantetheinyl transferase EntD